MPPFPELWNRVLCCFAVCRVLVDNSEGVVEGEGRMLVREKMGCPAPFRLHRFIATRNYRP